MPVSRTTSINDEPFGSALIHEAVCANNRAEWEFILTLLHAPAKTLPVVAPFKITAGSFDRQDLRILWEVINARKAEPALLDVMKAALVALDDAGHWADQGPDAPFDDTEVWWPEKLWDAFHAWYFSPTFIRLRARQLVDVTTKLQLAKDHLNQYRRLLAGAADCVSRRTA
jgi:hypothetical protein